MAELKVGASEKRENDIGPVIDAEAKAGLLAHIATLKSAGKLIAETRLPSGLGRPLSSPRWRSRSVASTS